MRPRILTVVALAALSGCGPAGVPVALQGEATFFGNPDGGALTVFPSVSGLGGIDFSVVPEMSARHITRQQVQRATVQSATIRVLSPADRDFGFLENFSLAARSGDAATVFADLRDVAQRTPPAPNPSLSLDLVSPDITQHVVASTLTVVMRGNGTVPARDTRVQVNLVVQVEATQ